MARDLNRVELIGRLGGVPEVRYTAAGRAVAQLSLATNREWKSADGVAAGDVAWHRLVAWDKTGEILSKNATKGSRLYIEGRLQYRKWTDSEGVDRYSTDIVVTNFIFLDARADVRSPDELLEEVL